MDFIDETQVRGPFAASQTELTDRSDTAGHLSALVDISYEPIFVWDIDSGITEWNAGAEMLYGYPRAEALGRHSHELLGSIYSVRLEQYLKELETDGGWSGEIRQFTRDGHEILIESRQQIIAANGRRLVIEINRHITERRAGENRTALLASIGEIIRTITVPADLLFAVSKAVGEFFQVRRCLFNEIDLGNDREIVHRDHCRETASVAGIHRLSAYSPVTSGEMMAGKVVINYDSQTDARTSEYYEQTYGPAGERSYVAVPLLRDSVWVASLWLSDDKPRAWKRD